MSGTTETRKQEIGLDPQDWKQHRRLAHKSVDETFDYLMSIRDRPAWQSVPPDLRGRIAMSPPRDGVGLGGQLRRPRGRSRCAGRGQTVNCSIPILEC